MLGMVDNVTTVGKPQQTIRRVQTYKYPQEAWLWRREKATKEWMTVVRDRQHGDEKLNTPQASPSSSGLIHESPQTMNETRPTSGVGPGAFDSLCFFPLELEETGQTQADTVVHQLMT
jgi:hypothetical protein